MWSWQRIMEKSRYNKRSVIKVIGNLLVVIAIIFLIKQYHDLGISIGEYVNTKVVVSLFPTVFLLTVLISFQFFPWGNIVRALTGLKTPMLPFYKVFQRANIMKYIPGNIFQYVGRGEILSERKELNLVSISASIILETFALLAASIVLGFTCIGDYMMDFISVHKHLFMFAIVCAAILILVVVIFRLKLEHLLRLKGITINKRVLLSALLAIGFFCCSLIIQAILQTFIIYSISGMFSLKMLLMVGGAYSMSWLAGYLTPGASGGIGVREALFCILLENHISSDIVLVSVVLFRGVSIVADILAYAGSILFDRVFVSYNTLNTK